MRYKYIVPLTGDLAAGRHELGGKGYNLQRLLKANFLVPGGFVVTARAFREALQGAVCREDACDPGAVEGIDAMRERLEKSPLPAGIEEEIRGATEALSSISTGPLVVRSSASSEDIEETSMAGQNASFVNVLGEDRVVESVRRVWASLFTRESLTYRSCRSGAETFPEMAVVVQQMVEAERAGVIFTVNPLTGNSGQCLLSASWGLGETVVSGRASDTLVLDKRSGRVLHRETAAKEQMLEASPGGGTHWKEVGPDRVRCPVVDDELARKLLASARRVEAVFGAPQDLEWAESGGRIFLLQARPVTGRKRGSTRTVWTNANVGEALPGVATPFTWSIIRGFSRQGFVHAFKALGCTVPEQYAIVGSVRGRVYLNISEFMSVMSQVPFISPGMLLRVAGGGGVEDLEGTYRKLSSIGFVSRSPLSLARAVLSRAVSPARVALWSQGFKKFCSEFDGTDLKSLSNRELSALFSRTYDVFESTGTLMLEVSSHFLLNYMVTSLVLKRVLGPMSVRTERTLFSGLSGIRSAEPGLDLLRMARRVASSPSLRERVLATPPERLLAELEAGGPDEQTLRRAVDAFLESHGHRAAREAEISEPRWREDPTFPLSVLQKYLQDPNPASPEQMVRQRVERREETTRRLLKSLPASATPFFSRLLRSSQEAARAREEMRNAVVRTIEFFRKIALDVGRRLAAAGVLRKPEDAFFLARDEHVEFLDGRSHTKNLALSAALRRLEVEALGALPDPPPSFVMEGDRLLAPELQVNAEASLAGLPGAPGRASGRVVVVLSPKEQGKVRHGDVLVARFTDVGWTPLFLVASAVVTELGGPLSHSCVVAREYGVPAVVNVKGAATILKDGDKVTVDGDAGTVYVEKRVGG